MSDPFRTLFNIGFPKPQNGIPALGKVGILGFINDNPPRLPMVKGLILGWVSVPVVTIKLNDDIMLRKIGVNQEFISDQFLRLKGYANILKQFIACYLQFVWRQFLLLKVHCPEMLDSFGVFVSTFYRAIFRGILDSTRQRPSKRLAANLARKVYLVSALPCYLMVKGTKEVLGLFHSDLWQIKLNPTMGAIHVGSVLPADCTTGLGAINLICNAGVKHLLTREALALWISRSYSLALFRAILTGTLESRWACLLLKFLSANLALPGLSGVSAVSKALIRAIFLRWVSALGYGMTALLTSEGSFSVRHKDIIALDLTISKPIAVTLYLATVVWSQWPGWGQTDVDTILAAGKEEDTGQMSLFGKAA